MNTYNENLQQTVVRTLAALSLNEANLDSAKTIAEITLYQAQGAEITAWDKMRSTQLNEAIWQRINDQARYNESQAINLLASGTESNNDVASAVTNTATAASNVQIASRAIEALAADVGAALNITTASLYETDVYERIVNANSYINEVANESKRIAKNAMYASAFASEITTTEVLAQTQTIKSKFDNIFKTAQAALGNFANLTIAERAEITQASRAERTAEGGLKDALREARAIIESYRNANDQVNLGLSVSVVSGNEVEISFSALPNPLPTFKSNEAASISVPPAEPTYYVAFLPAQSQSTFSLDQAQQIFLQEPERFSELTAPAANKRVPLLNDINGNPIAAGSGYVAYLYISISNRYKQFVANFSDVLSAPSQAFVPSTTLPTPTCLAYADAPNAKSGETWTTATLEGLRQSEGEAAEATVGTFEYRCILLQSTLDPDPGFLRYEDGTQIQTPPIYFNLALAETVAPANFTRAADGGSFKFVPGTTDNFGNAIEMGVEYVPYVLVYAIGEKAAHFANVLAGPFKPFVVWKS
ncbi:MAG: hypothetical protein ING75_03850 [Rhodocyclaceae bacterium]|nr:hypothetical protein [Rhodocyclaceae bacterium]